MKTEETGQNFGLSRNYDHNGSRSFSSHRVRDKNTYWGKESTPGSDKNNTQDAAYIMCH